MNYLVQVLYLGQLSVAEYFGGKIGRTTFDSAITENGELDKFLRLNALTMAEPGALTALVNAIFGISQFKVTRIEFSHGGIEVTTDCDDEELVLITVARIWHSDPKRIEQDMPGNEDLPTDEENSQ